jgi:hypothetical protein
VTACVGPHKPPAEVEDWQPPNATFGYLCGWCRGRLSTALVNLPAIAAWLQVNIEPGSNSSFDGRVSGSREQPIPLRQDVLDLIGPTSRKEISRTMTLIGSHFRTWPAEQSGEPSIYDLIKGWAKVVHEEAYADWPDRNGLVALCGWLHRQLDWITRQPWVDDMLTDLLTAQDSARRVVAWPSEQRRLKSDCPSCDMRSLVFVRGIGVECDQSLGGCGRTWDDTVVARPKDEPPVTAFDRLILVLGSAALEEAG